jgi:hypothetical protein
MLLLATLVAAGLLSLVHLFVGQVRFLDRSPGVWKSVAGGVGIAYTFLVLLPKLAAAQEVLEAATESGLYGFLVHHSYLLALTGLVLYYGMDAAVENALVQSDRRAGRPIVRALVYAHACSVSGYYFLVGYLMSEIRESGYVGFVSLVIFALAMLLHYLSIDHGLRNKYGGLYEWLLRWAFVAASMGGWLTASLTELSYETLALLNSLFAGALIVLTLKEKVPGSSYVRFRPFLVGVIGYSLLLLLIEVLVQKA